MNQSLVSELLAGRALQMRKLLFFAGHVPKPKISTIRYALWRQLVHAPNVTVRSHTLLCTYGAAAASCSKDAATRASAAGLTAACALRPNCHDYRGVQFKRELPWMRKTHAKLPPDVYLAQQLNHHFCLVAPGDFATTRKLSEAIVVGAMGGCVPVLVLPRFYRFALPYLRWLDYCEAAVLVSQASATSDFARLLPRLHELAADPSRRMYLKRIAPAFLQPQASEHILAEMCAYGRTVGGRARPAALHRLERCIL